MTGSECLPAELIVQYVDGSLDQTARAEVESHADSCPSCRVALSDLAAGSLARRSDVSLGDAGEPVDVAPGTAIARYLVLYQIGRGGMATVYAAYDPELDRKIAIKVLHGRGRGDHARLLREARTLAQLAHPNVVAVFDVGEHAGLLFLAMEFVEGQTMREWLAREKRTWRELAPVFAGAARALAAAHAQGSVHRDVKPENLLLDAAGVVRVSDFGLAARGAAHDAIAGTPAYMAPEQFDGEAGPPADVYALCVTLYEALVGRRPEGGDVAVSGVSRAIGDVVKRGLGKADARPTMAEVAAVLASDPARRKRQIAIGALALAASGALFFATRSSASGPQCDVAARAAKTSWSAKRDAVKQAFVKSKREPAFAAVDAGLAKYFADWGAMSTDSCERTRVRGDQSDALLDLRARCLDQRLSAATALVDVLASANAASVVEGAQTAVAGLPSIASCGDTDALTAIYPIKTEQRAPIEALQTQLARAAALQLTGQYPEATALVTPALAEAKRLDYPPVLAAAKHLEGDLLYRAGDYAASAAALTEAMAQAARGRDDRTATKALTLLAGIVGYAQNKPDEGMALALTADAWSARAGRVPEDEAELADIRGLLHDAKGEPLLAKPYYERALALREQLYGPDHLMVALSLNNLAGVPHTLGKYEEARKLHERARAIREKALGPVSSDLAVTLNAIASIDEAEDKLADAEKGFRRAIEVWEQVLGPEHPDVGAARNNLGNLLRKKGDYPAAIVELERALAIWQPKGGPEHPNAVSAIGNLGLTYFRQGDNAKALERYDDVVERTRKSLGAKHPQLAHYLVNRGQVLEKMQQHDRARADYVEAVKIFEVAAAGDRRLAWALTIKGKHELYEKQLPAASKSLAAALAILEADKEARPDELAAARFALARAKWDAGERAAAVTLAKSARDGADDKSVVDNWLAGKQ